MRLVALIEEENHVCYRYRLEAFSPFLAERGATLEAVSLAGGTLRRTPRLLGARSADVVILQRKLLPPWQLRLLRSVSRRFLYDVDDALFLRDSFHAKGPQSRKRLTRFRATVRAADTVIVGNEFLRETVEAIIGPRGADVRLSPTCVDPALYPTAIHQRTGGDARLGWIGTTSTLAGLQRAQPQLTAAARELPGLQLRIICDRGIQVEGVDVVLRRWSQATETAEVADCDIGVSWLVDDDWSRGKCGLKVIQYMAAGLPVVANPVGMNAVMVVHGETGLLAESPEEGTDAIRRLASDPALRRRMGQAGQRLARERYGIDAWGPRLASIVVGDAACCGQASRRGVL